MGCGKSKPSGTPHSKSPKLLVVDDSKTASGEVISTRLYVYSLEGGSKDAKDSKNKDSKDAQRCVNESTVPLPCNPTNAEQTLHRGFAVACNPLKPFMYIVGGTYTDGSSSYDSTQVWKTDYTNEDMVMTDGIANIPKEMKNIMAVVNYQNKIECLYVLCNESEMWRLNLETKNWDEVTAPPVTIGNVEALLAIDRDIYIICEGQLLKYTDEGKKEVKGEWNKVHEKYPKGIHAVLEDNIYTICTDTDKMYRFTVKNTKLTEIENHDKVSIQKCLHVVGLKKDTLAFVGYPMSSDHLTVTEYNVEQHKAVVAGYLKDMGEHYDVKVLNFN